MGELLCKNCKATIKADTFEEADELIDHSVGVIRGKPCNGDPLGLYWNEKPIASIVFHVGPGSEGYKAPKAKQSNVKDQKSESSNSPSKNQNDTTVKK